MSKGKGYRGNQAGWPRRRFLTWVGWGSLSALGGGLAWSSKGFFRPNVLYEPPTSFKVGYPQEYPLHRVDDRWKQEHGVWIVRNRQGIYALIARCTHLGCTPNWFPEQGRFQCPCHGSNFSPEGDVIAGPAPQPLFRAAIGLAADGQILVEVAIRENQPRRREEERFLLRV
ncbi:MAG: ubiquinol-cytochrome c reductase iron-sulfur subunit [Candidatus Tectomicrobia bacterium]|uniref:Ubiquinol-cytochrome c reductase iron-sulfur subunit n=1 Tax=Tectimicrobiota bacterium TaxID=2528274 RepID=A0A932CRG2_UNCTE|nr:ubiquinol-cytochrome c reductase iron-sulfur subunit [Candidatus Tectomicrobia bacterium]